MTTCRGFFSTLIAKLIAKFAGSLLLLGVLTLAGLPIPALAQQTLGSLNGTLTDSSGAVVQGVSVKARAVATNLEVTAISKSDGSMSA